MYHVIGFTNEDCSLGKDSNFIQQCQMALDEALKNLSNNPLLESYAVNIYFLENSEVDIIDRQLSYEYEDYAEVYFLNDGGLKMCADFGIHTNILESISDTELPKYLGTQWENMLYTPKC